ncbi:MAG: sugar transferase, partial [Anaerolineae bacterium]|nr:sugar transferase [Anaerolineae bacterium]
GPRPSIPYEVDEYTPWHRRRLQTQPGLTGLWQVTARSSADFDEMVRLDIQYIERQSFWLDLKILLKTPLVVLRGKGAL